MTISGVHRRNLMKPGAPAFFPTFQDRETAWKEAGPTDRERAKLISRTDVSPCTKAGHGTPRHIKPSCAPSPQGHGTPCPCKTFPAGGQDHPPSPGRTGLNKGAGDVPCNRFSAAEGGETGRPGVGRMTTRARRNGNHVPPCDGRRRFNRGKKTDKPRHQSWRGHPTGSGEGAPGMRWTQNEGAAGKANLGWADARPRARGAPIAYTRGKTLPFPALPDSRVSSGAPRHCQGDPP